VQSPVPVRNGRSEHRCQGRIGVSVAHFNLLSPMQSNRHMGNPPPPNALLLRGSLRHPHRKRLSLLDIASPQQANCLLTTSLEVS
jgi:hypothetical protein